MPGLESSPALIRKKSAALRLEDVVRAAARTFKAEGRF